MEFRQALRDMVISRNVILADDGCDRSVLVTFGSYCSDKNDRIQMQELKNILTVEDSFGQELYQTYLSCKENEDTSFELLAEKIESIADKLEANDISCFSYSYFISCYLELFKELFKDAAFAELGVETVEWVDPENYDYQYKNIVNSVNTFGFGRYRASIRDFHIENGVLKGYSGRDPYVIIPNFVKSIGKGAFANNKRIRLVYIPEFTSSIGAEAFLGCEKLETVVMSEGVTELLASTFEDCTALKRIDLARITAVGDRCFRGCVLLDVKEMPALTVVGDEAFSCCVEMKSSSIVTALTRIGDRAFEKCSINCVSLDNCTKLGAQAFLECNSLTRITLNSRITNMGVAPFMGCREVSLLHIHGQSIEGNVYRLFALNIEDFNSQIVKLRCVKVDTLTNSMFEGCACINEIEVKNGNIVPDKAFAECRALTSVKFCETVTAIGQSAFDSCESLKTLDMSFSGEEISERAFYKCVKLKPSALLKEVKVVGDFALAYTDLSDFRFEGSFSSIGAFAFANAKFPEHLSLFIRGCSVSPGAFHGVGEIIRLEMDATDTLYNGKLHLMFDSEISEFNSKRKINHLFVYGGVSEGAFKGYTNVRYIEFESMSGRIPAEAFCGCSALEAVKVNGSVSFIEASAFSECTKLEMLDMKYDALFVGQNAFSGCKHIHSLIELSAITRFGEYAFARTDISRLVLGKDVEFIGKSAFSQCADVQEVVIPFVGCMPQSGDKFGAIFGIEPWNGCNYQLVCDLDTEPGGYCIPEGVHTVTVLSDRLNDGDFDGCDFLTEVNLPNVVDFSHNYFKGCLNLSAVYLGERLDNFSAEAFIGCESAITVRIAEGCDKYASANGTVTSKDGKALYLLASSDKPEGHLPHIEFIGAYAVSRSPEKLVLPPNVKELAYRAINCADAKEISIKGVRASSASALYNCDSVRSIAIEDSVVLGSFSFNTECPVIETVSVSRMDLDRIADLFGEISGVEIDSLNLDEVNIPGAGFFDGIVKLRSLEIKSPIDTVKESVPFETVSEFSSCGQKWLVSSLPVGQRNIAAVRIKDAEMHANEFKDMTVDSLILENISVIRHGAFTGATVGTLTVKSVGDIECGAFTGSRIGNIVIDDEKYRLIDGVLYNSDEMLYCFDKTKQNILIPSFVKRVHAGAVEALEGLTQLSVWHSDVVFDQGAFVSCGALDTVELVGISNGELRELFDTVDGIKRITYTGDRIKRRFLSHIPSLQEVRLAGVTEIHDLAFSGDVALEAVYGLDTVTYVGDMAFADCRALKNVALPKECDRIGIGAFDGCASLTEIACPMDDHRKEFNISVFETFGGSIPDTVRIAVNGGDIPDGYFANVESEIAVTASPRVIGNGAFENSGLSEIDLTDTERIGDQAFVGSKICRAVMPMAAHIGDSAFSRCADLKSVVLNGSVEYLGENWILDSPISELYGADEGKRYRTASNYLVDCTSSTLIYIAPRSNITDIKVDGDVKRISASAFNGSNAVSLDVRNVAEIEKGAFNKCYCIEELNIEKLSIDGNSVALEDYFGENKRLKRISIDSGELVDGCFAGFDRLESAKLPSGTRSISSRCFAGCAALTDIGGLAEMESIGENAFEGCSSLEELTLPFIGSDVSSPNTLTYLFGDPNGLGLKKLNILNGEIVEKAFCDFDSPTEITLPSGIEIIPSRCFDGCSSLLTVGNTEDVKQIEHGAFMNCTSLKSISIPSLELLGDSAFGGCSGLETLILPESLKNIGKAVLNGCSSIASLTVSFTKDIDTVADLGKGVSDGLKDAVVRGRHLGEQAFKDCARLEGAELSEAFKDIPDSAFEGCSKLKSITGRAVKRIGKYAFSGCEELSELQLSDSVSIVKKEAFNGCKALKYIPFEDITNIGEKAFFGCSDLNGDVTLASVRELGSSAFEGCSRIRTVALNGELTAIPERAFAGCRALKRINIPESLTEIGSRAFAKTSMRRHRMNMPSSLVRVGGYLFEGAKTPTVYLLTADQSENWDPYWRYGCKRHGFLWLFGKVKVKILKKTKHRRR